MREPLIIITNNPLSNKKFSENYEVIYIDDHVTKVYEEVRDRIHLGHRILTHPLMSSIKPNETPYRTICITKEKQQKCDLQSISIIESAVSTVEKFLNMSAIPNYSTSVMEDFQVIDCDLIYKALN